MGTAVVKSGSADGKVKYPYDAMVYIEGSRVIAINDNGDIIKAGVVGTDDASVIQAALDYLNGLCPDQYNGRSLHIRSGTYMLSSGLTVTYPHRISGDGPSQTILACASAITLIDIVPAGSFCWEFCRFTLENLTLHGNHVGLYGITHNGLDGSLKVVKSQYINLIIRSFVNFGVVANNNWGNTFINVFFKENGTTLESGGILIRSECNYFYGCAFDWNACGLIFEHGCGSGLYGCVIEGNTYHGIWGHYNPSTGKYPLHTTIQGAWFESNGKYNSSHPTDPMELYDVYIDNINIIRWVIRDCETYGQDYVTKSICSLASSTTILNHGHGAVYWVTRPDGATISDPTNLDSVGDTTTLLSPHNQRIPPNIIIYKISSTCYAKDGVTGKIFSYSTTDQTVFNYVMTNAPAGSKIFIKRGVYNLSSSFSPSNQGVCLYGESRINNGTDGTVLKLTSAASSVVVLPSWCEIHDITINCNSYSCSSSGAIFIPNDTSGQVIDNVSVIGCGTNTSCIYVSGTTHTYGCTIRDSYLSNSYYPGVLVSQHANGGAINIVDNTIVVTGTSSNYNSGIYIDNGVRCNVSNNSITGSCKYGIYVCSGSYNNAIRGNIIANSVTAAVAEVDTSTNNIITDNIISGSSITSNAGGSLIYDNVGYVDPSSLKLVGANIIEVAGDVKGYWQFNDRSGTVVTDFMKYHNLTAAANVSTWVRTHPKTNSYYLSGASTDVMYCSSHSDFNMGNGSTDTAFSIIVAIAPAEVSVGGALITKYNPSGSKREWEFSTVADKSNILLYDESADAYIQLTSSLTLSTSTWTVLCFTYDGSGTIGGMKLYHNGVLDTAPTQSTDGTYVAMESLTGELCVGCSHDGSGNRNKFFNGEIAQLLITKKELSAKEVLTLTYIIQGLLGV